MLKPKTIVWFLAVGLFISLAPLPGWPAQIRTIQQINRNSDVPFGLAMPERMLENHDGLKKEEAFGCYILKNDDISYMVGGYPDIVLGKYHVVRYEINSSKYNLMGFKVGCSRDAVDKALKRRGFTERYNTYRKNSVAICVFSSDDVVTSFTVYVDTATLIPVAF